MAYPIENALGNSTSQSETDILAKSLDEQSHSNNVASVALHHSDKGCVTLSSSPTPVCPTKNLPALPLGYVNLPGPASTSMA